MAAFPLPTGRQEFFGPHGKEARVELVLKREEILLAERYQVKLGILTQPAIFSLTLGTGIGVAALLKKYPPKTPFELRIDGHRMMQGELDGRGCSGPSGIVGIQGRDSLAPLHDVSLLQEQTYKDDTYAQLVRKVLDSVGLKDAPLVFSNRANRASIVGLDPQNYRVKGTNAAAVPRDAETLQISDATTAGGAVKKHVQAQLGEKAYEFLKRHLDRAGLFLWASADGGFVLAEPFTGQPPIYRLHRSEGSSPEFSNIEDQNFNDNTVGRFSEIHVYPRGETKRGGRSKTVALVSDSEMIGWGYNRPHVLRDVDADSQKKAEFMGRRRMAESRRQGWKLSYTVRGHTTGSLVGQTVVWAPDTMVEVDDQKLGIEGNFWIEAVTFNGSPQATTVLDLMRPQDLIFGEQPT